MRFETNRQVSWHWIEGIPSMIQMAHDMAVFAYSIYCQATGSTFHFTTQTRSFQLAHLYTIAVLRTLRTRAVSSTHLSDACHA